MADFGKVRPLVKWLAFALMLKRRRFQTPPSTFSDAIPIVFHGIPNFIHIKTDRP